MTFLYVGGTKGFSTPSLTRLFHSILLTTLSIGIAITIGFIQLLTLIYNIANPTGTFWDGVAWLGNEYDAVGGIICGVFLIIGVGGVIAGKIVRKRRRRQRQRMAEEAA